MYTSLFSSFNFYFPNIGQFSNFRINKSKIEVDLLKMYITRCGGVILGSSESPPEQGKTLVRVKCSAKFDREKTDFKLAVIASKNNEDNLIKKQSPLSVRTKIEELLLAPESRGHGNEPSTT